jgi:hypothetical protein
MPHVYISPSKLTATRTPVDANGKPPMLAAPHLQSNASTGPSSPFSTPNPFFPSPSGRPCGDSDWVATQARIDPVASSSAHHWKDDAIDDGCDSSLDSITLDDGPNPIKPATPGRCAQTFIRAISSAGEAESPATSGVAQLVEPPKHTDESAALCGREATKMRDDGADSASDVRPTTSRARVLATHAPCSLAILSAVPGMKSGAFDRLLFYASATIPLVQVDFDDRAVAPNGSIAAPNNTSSAEPVRISTPQHDSHLLALVSSDNRAFVGTPGPFIKPVQCYIIREKATGGLLKKAPHIYKLFYEQGDKFLLGAQRRQMTTAPSYIVSLDERGILREGPSYYGKIKVCAAP